MLALAPLASLATCHPPHHRHLRRWCCRGHREFNAKKTRHNHTVARARACSNAVSRAFVCPREGVTSGEHTSGWRIGTQPASFSYSSIASAILVVMLAEHCGKREAVQGGKQTEGEEGGGERREELSKDAEEGQVIISHINTQQQNAISDTLLLLQALQEL